MSDITDEEKREIIETEAAIREAATCKRCLDMGTVSSVEYLPPATFTDRSGRPHSVGGGLGFVTRSCPECGGDQ